MVVQCGLLDGFLSSANIIIAKLVPGIVTSASEGGGLNLE
jgi:hypothetical protein